ncbi:MAG: hypothetical protein DYH15_01515 [Nitrosomonas sp. PRO4]|nr:hypothetical protein [Nitrosomonas sp. PRO4]
MFCSDQETHKALNSITAVARDQTRPLIIWVGAGVSSWAKYPFWKDLAAQMHTVFSREERNYNKVYSSRLLEGAKYPELFEQMRTANQSRYFTFLSDQFRPQHATGVYKRFIKALCKIPNVYFVTTNVDEALEHSLPEHITIQRSDIERLPQLIHQRSKFICKLHGSVSSVESMVFSTRDYESLQLNNAYLEAIQSIFSNTTVLFLGYGLRDEYVFQNLQACSTIRPLFGVGPHFIVTSEERNELPATVRRIRYEPDATDHRDALQVLEVIAHFASSQPIQTVNESKEEVSSHHSIYYLADLITPGRSTTSQTFNLEPFPGAIQPHVIIGEGYVNGEIEFYNYSALHDIVVGLLCFDVVCVSIDHLTRVHDLLGSEAFWIFVESGSLRLVIPPSVPAIGFFDKQSPIGDLIMVDLTLGKKSLPSVSERIRSQILPAAGKENLVEKLFQLLEVSIFDVSESKLSNSVAEKTRGALMNPSIRRMLGVSQGTPRNAIPRWLSFPTLRLAKVISSGIICQHIQASSARMIFGSEKLASVAFSAIEAEQWAQDAASYVLTGRFNSDVGEIIRKNPDLLFGIIKFRESSTGASFRREIAQLLAADNGSQIVTAINSGLNQAIPVAVLQQARDQFSGLFISRENSSLSTPVVWGDLRNSDTQISRWRKRSRTLFEEEVKRQRLGSYDKCPCGSGEQLKFCCQDALS